MSLRKPRILNIGCGGVRPQGHNWINVDNLSTQLPPHEMIEVNKEPGYVDCEIDKDGLKRFASDSFDGILASHFFEHFDIIEGQKIMIECRRLLRVGGALVVSVPNTTYFKQVYSRDFNQNWPELFETTDPKNPIPTFFEAALFFEQHKMLYTADSMWAMLTKAGFSVTGLRRADETIEEILPHLNRRIFSLEMTGYKP